MERITCSDPSHAKLAEALESALVQLRVNRNDWLQCAKSMARSRGNAFQMCADSLAPIIDGLQQGTGGK
jgi:hypothetical protein